ncbi:protein PAT1 homolog 1 [Diorhabda carinulata]|uniref:protein PAT1 homolog 1 n=1 Tax=Diorhabda carinulata TaxID=1163345 RepID=UPI0025A30058|nr:protein PAT1 homolog 1 [Diorhabda carinulata]
MANTFFNFDTSLNGDDHLLAPDDDDCLENEEEYDALNDETFGEDVSSLDDWEQQHEQFAEIAKNSIHGDNIEKSVSQLVLHEHEDRVSLSSSVWSYTPSAKNGDVYNGSVLSSSKTFIDSRDNIPSNLDSVLPTPILPAQPKKICTVEELEKSLINSSKNAAKTPTPAHTLPHPANHPQQLPRPLLPVPNQHQTHGFHPILQHPLPNTRLPPPGLPPMGIPPPGLRPPLNAHPAMLPPGMLRMIPPHPQFMQNGLHRPPGFLYPPHNQYPIGPPFTFPPPPRNMTNMNPQQQVRLHHNIGQHQHPPHQLKERSRIDSGNYRHPHKDQEPKDEYAGLMSMKEKQWLLNIQMLQLNTGTPYFDDYYYTIFKERKAKNNKENERISHHIKRIHRNSDRQENQNTLTPKVYTPLQFENSLGKLQCGSVTAPRKIIDMDIVTPDKDTDNPQVSRDTRKTKQLLLELEVLYSLLLKAEDINNPLYISNMDKLREIKQKQRLRELDLAPTPEQKREVLRLFKLESEIVIEHQYDYIMKITQGLLQEDKISSYLNIRKGKMLLLRLLPHLSIDMFGTQLLELWSKVLLTLPVTGRRDTAGDNILPKFYPFLKRYIQSSNMSDILDIVTGLVEVVRQENNRSTPLSHVGKSPLYFVLLNKFGVSALVVLLIRVECLLSSDSVTEKQQNTWSNFLVSWAQQIETVNKIPTPIDTIPAPIFDKHCNRFNILKFDKRSLLEKYFVDCNSTI